MKVTRIQVIPLVYKLEEAFLGGTYRIVNRNTLVTRVYTDAGIVGEAFGGDEDHTQRQIVDLIRDHFDPMLRGEDARDVERIWEKMFHSNIDLGNRGLHVLDLQNRSILTQAIAAVDNALWDALGKLYNVPLYKLLGGYRDKLPVIAIGGYYAGQMQGDPVKAEIDSYKEFGLAGIKFKVGRVSVAEDVRRVEHARKVAGHDFIIACDANQAWTPQQAIEFCRAVEGLNIRWIEEPVRWYDQLEGLRMVRENAAIPVTAGQGEISRFGVRDLVIHGKVNILNVDVTIAGGVTEWRRMAALASHFHVEMAHHEESQVSLHLLASIPHGLYVEIFPNQKRDPLWFELPAGRPLIKDGYMHLPSGPGLGMALNEEVIARYRAD
ncbi:MAG: mandelate racemase/muconate lactonizing enzyme family protein [Nitrososphaerales archaeon]